MESTVFKGSANLIKEGDPQYGGPGEEATPQQVDKIRFTGEVDKALSKQPTERPYVKHGAIKDSGTRTEFDTGAVRDGRIDKGRFDLLPMLALFRVARHYDRGCIKYGDRNWEKGIPLSKFWDSGIRHAFKAMMGFTDEDHMTSAVWNFLGYMETRDRITLGLLPASLNDMPETFKDVDYEAFEELLDQLL